VFCFITHVQKRFRDIARGGIRIVRSANAQAYVHNVGSLFDEVYALASTQQRKNKDIPEGGAKGKHGKRKYFDFDMLPVSTLKKFDVLMRMNFCRCHIFVTSPAR
jgi:hypothetical protein